MSNDKQWTVVGVYYKNERVIVGVFEGRRENVAGFTNSADSFDESEDMHESWIAYVDAPDAEAAEARALENDDDEQVPEHRNDLGDYCPDSGTRTADGTCPQFCREADDMAGFDAGREDDDCDEDEGN